jgi:polar amino acid transport system substrate-binding protein
VATTGCALIKQVTTSTSAATSTTVTISTGTDAISVADNAIQAVTKSAAITTPQVLKAGTLQAGSDTAFAPMEYPDAKAEGGYAGFDIDLCKAIAKKLGLTLQTLPTPYSDLVSSVLDDRFDMIMSALHITPGLQQRIAFSDAYLPGTLAITTPTGAPIAGSTALAGKRVGVQTGTMAQTVVAGIAGVAQVKDYNTILEAFQDLQNGKLDAVVSDVVVDAYIIENIDNYKTTLADSGTISTQYGFGYGFKPQNTALATAVNAALQELRTDGVYQKICAKWGVTGN